jgi:hypothetical protein
MVRETPSWVHWIKNPFLYFRNGFFVFLTLITVGNRSFLDTPLQQVLQNLLLNFTKKRYKCVTAFAC